jgi:hypothetical protein
MKNSSIKLVSLAVTEVWKALLKVMMTGGSAPSSRQD